MASSATASSAAASTASSSGSEVAELGGRPSPAALSSGQGGRIDLRA